MLLPRSRRDRRRKRRNNELTPAQRTPNEYRQAIPLLLAKLIPREEHDRWMLMSHSALNGGWPALAMQKENEVAVYQLLLWLKQGN